MRVLLCILEVLALLSTVPPASLVFNSRCSSASHTCRMKCNPKEFAVRYCDDWRICCKIKALDLKRRKKW
ncbi:PREDICTED: beta-defensin 43-like [Miniopterus natalensis]|uniref:beta-defensin 43-like n=1 Tax=Miniopterus natalensis TaxID=291302 RepID=UPI0007A6AD1E|nr:PREDICTED: beta-defensin 43-like [Miniopterus natalensis]